MILAGQLAVPDLSPTNTLRLESGLEDSVTPSPHELQTTTPASMLKATSRQQQEEEQDSINSAEVQAVVIRPESISRKTSEYTLRDLSLPSSNTSRAAIDIEAAKPGSPSHSISKDEDPSNQLPVFLKADAESIMSPTFARSSLGSIVKRSLQKTRQSKLIVKVERFFSGPLPPEDIQPRIFRREQVFEKSLQRFLGKVRRPVWLVYALFFAGWIVGVSLLVNESWFNASTEAGEPQIVSNQASFWSPNDECGLGGASCEPFSNSTLAFRCGARSIIQLLNPRVVGSQELNYRPLLVGGGDETKTYRADTWLCAAAVQQGLVSYYWGGCSVAAQTGGFSNYLGFSKNGLQSVSFDSYFPSSYVLQPSPGEHCKDLKWPILAFQVSMMFLFSIALMPSPALFFWVATCAGYWQIVLTKSPPDISTGFGAFLPTLFVLYSMWRCAARFVLPGFNQLTVERSTFFLGPFWVGILMDVTLESWIPIDRLTAHDIKQRPGGLVAVIILVLLIAAIAINQLRLFRKAGLLVTYIRWYALGGVVIGILAALPGLDLRLHHYIFGMIALPLIRFPTRISLVLLALLLGILINGIAIWGYDSILQTPAELRGDAPLGSDLPEWITNNVTFSPSTGLSWQTIPPDLTDSWNGFALIVDDVLAWTGIDTNYTIDSMTTNVTHYFRLAYTKDGTSGDFTRPATWLTTNNTWIDAAAGHL